MKAAAVPSPSTHRLLPLPAKVDRVPLASASTLTL
jgi:hypothetical protein